MQSALRHRIARTLGVSFIDVIRMLAGGGHIRTWLTVSPSGQAMVVKEGCGHRPDHLTIEARMLLLLRSDESLPAPDIIHSEDDLLILSHLPHDGGSAHERAEIHLGHLLATLHDHTSRDGTFGHTEDNLIGLLPQPNGQDHSWIRFFREQRLEAMMSAAKREGKLPDALHKRLMCLSSRLDHWLLEPEKPALLHGDLWSGNILSEGDSIVGLVDPAPYFGHPEIELAYGQMFGPCGPRFFKAYKDKAYIAPGFFEERLDIYNLYPLLVHLRLFGRTYLAPIDDILRRKNL